jgi:hypothetical protein
MTPLKRGYRSEILLTMLGFACACPLKHNSPQRPRLFPQELGCFFGLRQADTTFIRLCEG